MRRSAIILAVVVIIGALAAYAVNDQSDGQFTGNDISGAKWARAFELSDHNGQRRTLADFQGKVVLMFFGYTNCPDVCPTALAEMAQVVKQLGPDGNRVQGLFVTVDPERDTHERLAAYVPAFYPSFLGLRGSANDIKKVANEFKIFYEAEKSAKSGHSGHGADHGPYMVNHSTGIYAFDRQGRVRLHFSASSRTVETMVHDTKRLLRE